MPPLIVLADDHRMFREGLKAVLAREHIDVAAEASNGQEAVTLVSELQPDIALLDFAMPLLNGLHAARMIHQIAPRTRTMLLTVHTEDAYVLQSIRAGIRGYVVKTDAAEDLVRAIGEVMQGRVYLSPSVSQALVDALVSGQEPRLDPLTQRESQVVQLVAEGKTTKEIAQVLEVGVKTAESHRSRAMEKLGIHDTAGLVRYAIRQGLIDP